MKKEVMSSSKASTTITRAKRGTATETLSRATTMNTTSGEAVLVFERFGTPKQAGKIAPGAQVKINYDYHRLLDEHPECIRRTPNGDIGEIQMGVKFDDDPTKVQYVKFVAGYSHATHYKVPIQNTITVPKSAKKVELWFSSGGPLYNYAFDSNYNKNYVFEAGKED